VEPVTTPGGIEPNETITELPRNNTTNGNHLITGKRLRELSGESLLFDELPDHVPLTRNGATLSHIGQELKLKERHLPIQFTDRRQRLRTLLDHSHRTALAMKLRWVSIRHVAGDEQQHRKKGDSTTHGLGLTLLPRCCKLTLFAPEPVRSVIPVRGRFMIPPIAG
jgi:hypothetical protein